jgi:hypothetical protein
MAKNDKENADGSQAVEFLDIPTINRFLPLAGGGLCRSFINYR